MKSLIILNDFPPILGGQSTYFNFLCKGLPSHKFIVLAPKIKGCENFDIDQNFKIIRKFYVTKIPFLEKIIKIIIPIFHVLSIMKKYEIKIIHCGHVLSTGLIGFFFKKFFNIPYVIYTFGSDILEFQKYTLIKKILVCILKNAESIITVSNYTKLKLKELGISEEKIIISYPRIDYDYFNNNTDESINLLEKYDLKSKKVILSVNRLVERKGNDFVIKSLPKIKEKIPNAVYMIIGDGDYKDDLVKLAEKNNVKDYVIFVPSENFKGKEASYYQICDVFIMASRFLKEKGDAEGFGIVFLEANACGKPVIGGNSGGIPDAVANNKTGLLVDANDINSISEAVIKILEDNNIAKFLGINGRMRVQENFNWKKGIKELEHLF